MSERRSIQSEGGIWGENLQEPAEQGQNHYKELLRFIMVQSCCKMLYIPFFPLVPHTSKYTIKPLEDVTILHVRFVASDSL